MPRFGSATPKAMLVPTGSAGAFPRGATNPYVSANGAVTIPAGALDRWFAYRTAGQSAVELGDVVIFGDSTTFGASGGVEYSYVQQVRNRSVAAGYTDGGKGIYAGGENDPVVYDAPEINGVASMGFNGGGDFYDTLTGGYYTDSGPAGNAVVFQFRTTAVRLWYVKRSLMGTFTYSIDGGTAVTVDAHAVSGNPNPHFVYIGGLTAGTTHTLTVTNTSSSKCQIACSPVNATGIVYQKQAITGSTFANFFYGGIKGSSPFTQANQASFFHQVPLGLSESLNAAPNYTGATVDTSYGANAVRPKLAISNLGFNDLSNSTAGDEGFWTEYVKRFAGACTDAGCPGVIVAGQLPYNANWPTLGASRFNALKAQALASGLGFVDLFYPIGGPSLSYSGGTSSPHLSKAQYITQGDFLWDNLLGLV